MGLYPGGPIMRFGGGGVGGRGRGRGLFSGAGGGGGLLPHWPVCNFHRV